MKKIIVLYLTMLVIHSCVKETHGTLSYTIENKSEKRITVKGYISTTPMIPPIITKLEIGEKITKTETAKYSYDFTLFFGEGQFYPERDSVVVIYDNIRKSIFKKSINCIGDQRNPLNTCKYGGKKSNVLFVFTKEDYENAKDCNGDCD